MIINSIRTYNSNIYFLTKLRDSMIPDSNNIMRKHKTDLTQKKKYIIVYMC